MQQSLFYDWKHHIKLFILGGGIKPGEEKGDLVTKSITMLFVEQSWLRAQGLLITKNGCFPTCLDSYIQDIQDLKKRSA